MAVAQPLEYLSQAQIDKVGPSLNPASESFVAPDL
jgi:hypothetical protein